jgi:hypothetical protein
LAFYRQKTHFLFGRYGKNALSLHRFRNEARLDYGVMAAQQVLVLFVQVRILVVQPKESPSIISMGFFMPFSKVDTNKGMQVNKGKI